MADHDSKIFDRLGHALYAGRPVVCTLKKEKGWRKITGKVTTASMSDAKINGEVVSLSDIAFVDWEE
ncbi:MAG: hypothetical protein AAB965_03065 [Patescibacteria group bacterium]